ncbi:MAG: hypothetical protein KF773_23270 [Deltaproteobacteria bacterium]|nr:hypothetical protein [Deltaproteobacteria bacterium]MCW5808940.1 hypothetical protein [Deltaproteobacteria bacterium]
MRTAVAVVILVALAGAARADDVQDLAKGLPTCEAARAHCFGITIHVPVVDGKPITTTEWLAAQLAQANRHFAAIDVAWQLAGTVGTLPASAARVEDVPERNSFAPKVTGTVIHVFITGQLDDIDEAGQIAYGVTWRPNGKVYVILSTMARERTLAHELGHVFGLPHSTHAISIMNKSDRKEPPPEQRTFHDDELAIMKKTLARFVRDKFLTRP